MRLHVWDFGGQALYHQTHRLFFQSGAVYVVLWDPWPDESQPVTAENQYRDQRRPLQYWIDQIYSVDEEAIVAVVRSQTDRHSAQSDPDWRAQLPRYQDAIDALRIQFFELSAKDRLTDSSQQGGEQLRQWLTHWAVPCALGGPKKRERLPFRDSTLPTSVVSWKLSRR